MMLKTTGILAMILFLPIAGAALGWISGAMTAFFFDEAIHATLRVTFTTER